MIRTSLLASFLTAVVLHLVILAVTAFFWGVSTDSLAPQRLIAAELVAVTPIPEPARRNLALMEPVARPERRIPEQGRAGEATEAQV